MTKTETELPPLPAWCESTSPVAEILREYARAAIEAARPAIIAQFLEESGQYVTNDASRQAEISAACNAALKDAVARCEDIYSWPGTYNAGGLMDKHTLKVCAAAIRALRPRYDRSAIRIGRRDHFRDVTKMMPPQGQEISIDVSTSERDAGRRVFGKLTGEVNGDVWLAEGYVNEPGPIAEPAFFIDASVIDPATGKIAGGVSEALTWSDVRIGGWQQPVFLAAPAADQPSEQDREDAKRYRFLRTGRHWSTINGIGDELRDGALDTAIDIARAKETRNNE